jgi:PST family polysaccharide transporter
MKLLEGVAWSAIRGWGSRAINLAVFFVSARYLSPADIGVFSLVAAYLLIFQVLGEGGLADYIVQRVDNNPRQDSAIFFAQIATSLSIGAALAGLSPWVGPLLIKHPDAALLFAVTAITVPMAAAVRVPEALLRKQLRFKALAMRGLITSAISGVVGITLAIKGYGVWALIVKTLVEVTVDGTFVYTASRWRPMLVNRGDRPLLTGPYAYGKHLLGARLVETFYQRIDTLLIGHFLGNSALGFYSVGQKIYQALIELLSKVFTNVAVPYMAKEKGDPLAVRKVYFDFLNLVSMLAFPIFAYIFMFARELILLLFGQVWAESAWILQAFCLLGAVNCVMFFNGPVLVAMGDSKSYFGLMIQRTVILLVLCVIGLSFGLPGVVAAMVLGGIVIIPLMHRALQPWIKVSAKDVLRELAQGVLVALVLGAGVAVLKAALGHYALSTQLILSGGSFFALLAMIYYTLHRSKNRMAIPR